MEITFLPLSKEIIDHKVKWLNDANVNRFLYGEAPRKKTTIKEQKDWFLKYSQDELKQFFTIFVDQKIIGIVGLKNINQLKGAAEIFILIGDEKHWHKGIGSQAMKYIIDFAQNKTKLKELNLSVHKDNKYAIELFTKFGFKKHRFQTVEMEMKKIWQETE